MPSDIKFAHSSGYTYFTNITITNNFIIIKYKWSITSMTEYN